MTDRDESDYGEDLPHGWCARVIAGLVIAIFLVSTYGTGVADTFFAVQGIELVGAEAQEQRQLASNANLWDGTLARYYESRFRERSLVRELVLPRYSFLKYAYLDEAPRGIVVGDDHWLFLRNRIKLVPREDHVLATSAVNTIVAFDRRVRGNGTALTTLPIPRKSWVARDFLPRGVDGRNAVDDLLIEGLLERGVSTVDLRDPYRPDDPREIYFKLDTHWTPNAARIAAEEAARAAGLLEEVHKRVGTLEATGEQRNYRLGFATLASLGVNPEQVDVDGLDLRDPLVTQLRFKPLVNKWVRNPTPTTPYALAGTSFSHQQRLARLLTHFCGAGVFDAAEPAQLYMTTVHQALEAYTGQRTKLEHLFWEIPIATIFQRPLSGGSYYPPSVGHTYLIHPPQEKITLQPLDESWIRCGKGELSPLDEGRQILIELPYGTLAHSGDGAAALRLSGLVKGATLPLMFENGATSVGLDLEPGEFDFVMPVLSEGPTSAAVRLTSNSGGESRLRIDKAALVHQPVRQRVDLLKPTTSDTALKLEPSAPLFLGPRAALGIQVDESEEPWTELEVELHTAGSSTPRVVRFKKLQSTGWVVLDLGHEAGTHLLSVVVRAGNGAPAVASAMLTGARKK